MDNTDPISKALELTPLEPLQTVEVLPAAGTTEESKQQIVDDFEYARGNLITVIEKGQEALQGIVDVAGMSQHPRSYEVVATLISSVTNANKDLLELQKRKKDLLNADETKTGSTTNNLFVGSTADLLKMIKSKNGL
jgi:hypothetical protein